MFAVVVFSIPWVQNVMDKRICKSRDHRYDSKASGKEGIDKPMFSAFTRSLATGTAHRGAECKYTVELNVVL